jgi:hypothetical protein
MFKPRKGWLYLLNRIRVPLVLTDRPNGDGLHDAA